MRRHSGYGSRIPRLFPAALALCATLVMLFPPAPSALGGQGEDHYSIFLRKVICDVETDEVGADAIYGRIVFADINPSTPRTLKFTGIGVFGSFDAEEERDSSYSAWNSKVTNPLWSGPIPNPNHLLVLTLLMEQDDFGLGPSHDAVVQTFNEGLVSYARAGGSRSSVFDSLARDIRAKWSSVSGYGLLRQNVDDIINIRELPISAGDLELARTTPVSRIVEFRGDGGRYRLVFELVKSLSVSGARSASAPTIPATAMRVDSMSPAEGSSGTVVYINGANLGTSGRVVMSGPGGSFTMGIRAWFRGAVAAVVPDRVPPGDYTLTISPSDAIWRVSKVFRVTVRR